MVLLVQQSSWRWGKSMGAEFPLGSSRLETLVFSEQEISPPSPNESRATKQPPLLLANPHRDSRQRINCLCLVKSGGKGTLEEGSKSDQKGSVIGLCGIWNLDVNFNKIHFP